MTTVVGVSGVSGAGKTTLVKRLASNFQATFLLWDDFDSISTSPADYVAWYRQGQDYNEWNYEALANVLKALKAGKTLLHPTLKHQLSPTHYIFFDAPLGYLHPQTGRYIDINIHIHVPLDISLCRRLIRDFKNKKAAKDGLVDEIAYYLNYSRSLFFDDKLKKSSDHIIDGTLSIEELQKEVETILIRNKG